MINFLCTVFDTKAEVYEPPFAAPTENAAERMFSDAVNDGQSRVAKHPEDYQLFLLGTFDTSTGEMTAMNSRKILGTGVKYVASE